MEFIPMTATETVIDGNELVQHTRSVHEAVSLAAMHTRETRKQVRFEFNNVTITVAGDSDEGLICDTYLFAPRYGVREIGPYPARVEEFDDAKAKPYVLHDHGHRPEDHLEVLAYQLIGPGLAWGFTRSVNVPSGPKAWLAKAGTWYVKVVKTGETFLLRGEDDPWNDTFRECDCSTT